ncbi:hypothetical protein G7K_1854-t1 [Saitoella complicata NRRL Y-17804]|uniref:Uncharacterized protein n=1 Tax=Saitoella complicata (strain BCRC 22490 / CBS 7301 / JCM 7358 / NBRC 10748 / NRRL Y-17804) TaxID=698492 RepID=A0A0E9NE15_SAICN|nr:hypothetical protein G7K_1854-t1 [Saitoella complicata NRRL Y-17804]
MARPTFPTFHTASASNVTHKKPILPNPCCNRYWNKRRLKEKVLKKAWREVASNPPNEEKESPKRAS